MDEIVRDLIAATPKIVADIMGGRPQAAERLIAQAQAKNPDIDTVRFCELVVAQVSRF